MKPFNLIAAGVALSAGLVGGTATYLVAAEPTAAPSPARTTQVSTPVSAPVHKPKPIVKLAKCKAPAVREGKACVTEVVQTVVLPAPPAPAAPSGHVQIAAHGDDDGHHGTGPDDDETRGDDHANENESEDEDHADEDEPGDEDHGDEDQGHDD